MGIISNNLLLEKGLRAEFLKAFNNGESPQDVMGMIMETTSNSDSEKYGWLGEVAQLTEWKDERTLRGLKDFDFTIENVDYESTLKVNKNVMDDDQLGAVKIRIRDLAARAKTHSRKLFFDKIAVGTVDLGYDGVPFFSNSHPESGSNQDNLLGWSASGAVPTTAEFSTAFKAARAAMRGFVDDQGEPRNEGDMKLKVVCGTALESAVEETLNATIIDSTTNALKGAATKLVTGRLSGLDWYLLDESGEIKPFVLQKRSPIKFESMEKGERAFMRKELLFGVDYRIGFDYGVWYKAIKQVES